MSRSTSALALITAPTWVAAHTGDHSPMNFGGGVVHAVAEHWGWLCVVALLAVVYAVGSSFQSRTGKARAKRPPSV